MIKKLSILVLALAISLSIASPKLRTEVIFRPSQLISVLSDQLSFLNIGSFTGSESEYLNELAQALAENGGNAIEFINSYPKSKSTEAILTFGFKLRANTKLRTIMFNDSTEIVDHMNGFLDFRYKNSRINLQAREIRELIKAGECPIQQNYHPDNCKWARDTTGQVKASTANFNKVIPIKRMRDITPIITLYDEFLESQIKLRDANGRIPLGWIPLTFNMDFKNFNLKIESTDSFSFPLTVDPSLSKQDLLEAIDNHHRVLVENTTLEEALQLTRVINTYGVGVYLNEKDDTVSIVYSFGSQHSRVVKKTNLRAKLSDYEYISANGERWDFNPFNFRQNTFAYVQRRNNQLLIDAVNMHRLTSGLRPLRQMEPRLYELAQENAEKMLSAGKLVEPKLASDNKKTALVAMMVSGETTVKEFLYDVNDEIVGSVGCFDNFSNQRSKVYNFFDFGGNLCNRAILDNYSKFDAFGSGVAYNDNGDLVSVFILSETD